MLNLQSSPLANYQWELGAVSGESGVTLFFDYQPDYMSDLENPQSTSNPRPSLACPSCESVNLSQAIPTANTAEGRQQGTDCRRCIRKP